MADIWDLIESGKYEEACRAADEEWLKRPSLGCLGNKATALLCLGRYEELKKLNRQMMEVERVTHACNFIVLGLAHWFLKEYDEAVVAWRGGVGAQYADAAGGVESPLLLFYAAIRRGDEGLRKEARKLLRPFLRKKSALYNWPGALAPFVLGKSSEKELLAAVTRVPILRDREKCQALFYIGVMRLAQGDKDGFVKMMKASSSQPPVAMLEREYFLAKAEAEQA